MATSSQAQALVCNTMSSFHLLAAREGHVLRLALLVKEKTYRLYRTTHVPKFLLTVVRLNGHSQKNRLVSCSSVLSVCGGGFGSVQCCDIGPAKVRATTDASL